MKHREAVELLSKVACDFQTEKRGSLEGLKSMALLGAGGTGLGAGLGLLASEFVGDQHESNPELARIKKRKRRQSALLGGAALGGLGGGSLALAGTALSGNLGASKPGTSLKNTLLDPWNALMGGGAATAIGAHIAPKFQSMKSKIKSLTKLEEEVRNLVANNKIPEEAARKMLSSGKGLRGLRGGIGAVGLGLAGLGALGSYAFPTKSAAEKTANPLALIAREGARHSGMRMKRPFAQWLVDNVGPRYLDWMNKLPELAEKHPLFEKPLIGLMERLGRTGARTLNWGQGKHFTTSGNARTWADAGNHLWRNLGGYTIGGAGAVGLGINALAGDDDDDFEPYKDDSQMHRYNPIPLPSKPHFDRY